MATIVVGVDGSADATEALRFALDEARARDAEIVAVAAWDVPPGAFGGPRAVALAHDFFRSEGQERLDRSLEAAGEAGSGVRVTGRLVKGDAGHVLCAAAQGADLLVVGSRGLGGVRTLLLGSVSLHCAQHAPCPVVIVPAGRQPRDASQKPQAGAWNP